MVTRGLYSYLIFTQKIVNRAKKGVLHGTPKIFLKVSQDVFTMHNTQSTKINQKINFILHGLATRKLSVKKKVTRNSHFSRPAETDPYSLATCSISFACPVTRCARQNRTVEKLSGLGSQQWRLPTSGRLSLLPLVIIIIIIMIMTMTIF